MNALLDEGRASGVFSQAALVVVRDGEVVLEASAGGPVDAVFDVASVTKVVTAALVHERLALDAAVSWLPGAPCVGDLLAHRAGLRAWRPFFALAEKELGLRIDELVARTDLHGEVRRLVRGWIAATPADAPRPTYSDLGFLALGFALEDALPDLARDTLFAPLGLASMEWGGARSDAVPTGRGRPRAGNPTIETELLGAPRPDASDHAVDDDNAAVMGGVCGHAGLWSNARDLAILGDSLRTSDRHGDLFVRASGSRTFGLDTPSGASPAIGTLLGRGPLGAAGHLGFTGCSLWIDRDARLSIALLTNAVALARPSAAMRAFRPRVHDAVARALGVG